MITSRMHLRYARRGDVLCSPTVVTDAPVPFRIIELEMLGNLEGLIAQTLIICNLNLDSVQQEYWMRGMSSPWEVEIDEVIFIVESDGSLITFLSGFPSSVIEQARSALEHLAHNLYEPIEIG